MALVADLPALEEAWRASADAPACRRALLTAVAVQQLTDVRVWSHLRLTPEVYLDASRLKRALAQLKDAANSAKLPQTLADLCKLACRGGA